MKKASNKRDELNLRRKKIQNEGISFLRELNFRILVISLYLESLVSVINNGVQSRGGETGCFIILTASSQLNLAVFTNKRYRTGTVVPNICGLTDLRAGSSIETRIVLAAAVATCDVSGTWSVGSLMYKNLSKYKLFFHFIIMIFF